MSKYHKSSITIISSILTKAFRSFLKRRMIVLFFLLYECTEVMKKTRKAVIPKIFARG